MSPSGKLRLGMIGLTMCLAGGITLHFCHRTDLHALPPQLEVKAIPASHPKQAQSGQPKAAVAIDETFPNPDASASDQELLALARKIVAASPQRAIAWARSQSDSILRARLLFAVVRAWGENDPDAAVDWVLMQDDSERQADMDAALAGAVKQPQLALSIVDGLLKYYDSKDGAGAGPALVVALNNAGQFQTALEFINDGPTDSRMDWTKATFQRWGESQPQDAVKALDSIADEKLRDDAFHAIADGWSASNPSALANYAATLPDSQARTYAMNKAVDNWSLQDPGGLADWLTTSPTGVDFDQAVATLIAKSDGANRTPEVAMQWVEKISDPNLKYDSLMLVLNQWNQANPVAAQTYAANVFWLDEQKREELLQNLQNPPLRLAASNND